MAILSEREARNQDFYSPRYLRVDLQVLVGKNEVPLAGEANCFLLRSVNPSATVHTRSARSCL
jgi:hypothetical protein